MSELKAVLEMITTTSTQAERLQHVEHPAREGVQNTHH